MQQAEELQNAGESEDMKLVLFIYAYHCSPDRTITYVHVFY